MSKVAFAVTTFIVMFLLSSAVYMGLWSLYSLSGTTSIINGLPGAIGCGLGNGVIWTVVAFLDKETP